MRAVILAAGEGTRLRPLTDDRPKCLVELWGRPILEHTISTLHSAGIDDVMVVAGHGADQLKRYGLPLRVNPDYATTNMVHSLFCAEDCMDQDLLVVYGDIVFAPRVARALLASIAPIALAVNMRWRELWELRMAEPLHDLETLRLDAGGKIRELGKRPRSYSDVEGQYMGLIRFAAQALPAVRKLYHNLDRTRLYDGRTFQNMHMTSFLQTLIDHGMTIHPVRCEGGWLEVDSLEDLAAYRTLAPSFLDRDS